MTSSATTTDRDHPIAVALSGWMSELVALQDQPTWSMGAEETREVLVCLPRFEAMLAELKTRVVVHGQTMEVENQSGASSTANWWAHATRQTRAQARRTAKLAAALAQDVHEPVRTALADGEVLPDQAEVIIAAIQALPEELDADLVQRAQATLLGYAAEHDAKALRVLGKRILDVVAPEVGEAHEAQLLEKEAEADRECSLRMSDDGHGKTYGRFTLPTWVADQVRKHLTAIAAPKHRVAVDGHAPDPARPPAHKLGQAFSEYIQRYPAERLPNAGGLNATAVVLIPYETLIGGLKAAQLDTGTRISPGLSRRLACEAGVIPAVLGGKSEVLDLGRKRRFHSKAQRIALMIQQHGICAAEGCDRPASATHAHHAVAWADGGPTSVTNGMLLCWPHHARAHDRTYDQTRLPHGKVRYHRRT